ncbi:MAG: GNAT family N-acetyltransferase [Clostridiales bacterium]
MSYTYKTKRLILKVLSEDDVNFVLDYYIRNREFLDEWEMKKDNSFYTTEVQKSNLQRDLKDYKEGRLLRFWIFKKEEKEKIIGSVAFSNIVRGAFLSCNLGYKSDLQEINKGFITEAVEKGIEIIFNEYKLHRIEANIMPKNKASFNVVEKLGFYNEGRAYKYLKINGNWEDHIHMVLLNSSSRV